MRRLLRCGDDPNPQHRPAAPLIQLRNTFIEDLLNGREDTARPNQLMNQRQSARRQGRSEDKAPPAVVYLCFIRCDAIFATRDEGALQFRPPGQRGR
jgi:hypothetical protein